MIQFWVVETSEKKEEIVFTPVAIDEFFEDITLANLLDNNTEI